MLVSNVILVTTLFFASSVCEARHRPRRSDDPRSKKGQQDQGYIEQCHVARFLRGQLGHVNVVAFLDASWQYSYRQLVMLEFLKKRLDKSGFSDIRFFAVAASPNYPYLKTVNDIQVEAWREIFAYDSSKFFELSEVLFNDLASQAKQEITVIQDTRELRIWEYFHAAKDEVVILDRCGKLTYQVIVPWSILYFPYVKAAILSTYKEDPCGPCDIHRNSFDYEVNLLENASTEKEETDKREWQNARVSLNETKEPESEKKSSTAFPTDVDINTDDTATSNLAMTTPPAMESETSIEYSKLDGTEPSEETTLAETVGMENGPIIENSTPFDEEEDRTSPFYDFTTTENYSGDHTLLDEPIDIDESLLTTNRTLDLNEKNPATDSNDTEREDMSSVDYSKANEAEETDHSQVEALPIRLIMRAPHFHKEDGTSKKYESLILKTGSSEYHGHQDSENDALPSFWQIHEGDDVMQPEDTKLIQYVYSPDESPGLYGEVADFGQSYDDSGNVKSQGDSDIDYDDIDNTDKESRLQEDPDVKSNSSQSSDVNEGNSKAKVETDSTTDVSVQNADEQIQSTEVNLVKNEKEIDTNSKEQEAQLKVIEHYSKLLPWISYVLDK